MLEDTRAMEQPTQTTAPLGVSSVGQLVYATPTYQPAAVVTGAPAVMGVLPSAQPGSTFPTAAALASQHQLAYQQVQQFHHQQQQHQHRQLQAFWAEQMSEIEQTTDFKNHSLPLARIKKIMKADEDVQMISAEAPVIFAKACEIFILELTLRSWIHTEENKRRTLQKNDIAAAITRTDIFDFLVDIVPRDELKEEGLGIPRAAIPAVGGASGSVPYYYVPAQNPAVAPGMIMGTHVDHTGAAASAICGGQQPRPMAFMWQSHQAQPPQQSQQQHMPDSS